MKNNVLNVGNVTMGQLLDKNKEVWLIFLRGDNIVM